MPQSPEGRQALQSAFAEHDPFANIKNPAACFRVRGGLVSFASGDLPKGGLKQNISAKPVLRRRTDLFICRSASASKLATASLQIKNRLLAVFRCYTLCEVPSRFELL